MIERPAGWQVFQKSRYIASAKGTSTRTDGKQMPSLQKYLEHNLPGLKIKAMVCDDEKLKKWKEEQKPKKEVLKARKMAQQSSDSSSISSSDEENVNLDT